MLTRGLLALRWLFSWFTRTAKSEPTKPKKIPAKKPAGESLWDLPTLLDNLDAEHERHEWKHSKYSCIRKRELKALNAYGPLLFPHDYVEFPNPKLCGADAVFDEIKSSAPMMQMHVGFNKEAGLSSDADKVHINSVFALRQGSSCPPLLQKAKGELYIVGCSYNMDGKDLAFASYAWIDFDSGQICVPKMHLDKKIALPSGKSYCRKEMGIVNEEFYLGRCDSMRDRGDLSRMIRSLFVAALRLWQKRDRYYQVSTKRKGRVTFCIPPGKQVAFFRNRDLDAIASDGKRKRIVHFVEAHDRALPDGRTSHVREHLRGIRRFRWKGYFVAITVPKFHITAYNFPLAPVTDAERKDTMSAKKVSRVLSDIEDTHTYSHGERA